MYLVQFVLYFSFTIYWINSEPITQIHLGIILPFSSNSCADHNYVPWALDRGTKAGIEFALEKVNKNNKILKGYNLVTTYADSFCSDIIAPIIAIDMYINGTVDVFLGPVNDYAVAPIGRYTPRWNIPLLTGGAFANALADKNQYNLLTQSQGLFDKLSDFIDTLFTELHWHRSVMLYANNRNKHTGHTIWYFHAEGVLSILKQLNGNEPYVYSSFDDNSYYNPINTLLDICQQARGKNISIFCFTFLLKLIKTCKIQFAFEINVLIFTIYRTNTYKKPDCAYM